MTKAALPEPVAVVCHGYDLFFMGGGPIADLAKRLDVKVGDWLITTTQAEAYANARVREALEAVESTLESMQTAALKQRVPEDEDEGGWNGDCIASALAISQAILEIRTLLPSTPA